MHIHDGKGAKDRVVTFPEALHLPMRVHLQHVELLHRGDLALGHGQVYLPFALKRKYPSAGRDWSWQ